MRKELYDVALAVGNAIDDGLDWAELVHPEEREDGCLHIDEHEWDRNDVIAINLTGGMDSTIYILLNRERACRQVYTNMRDVRLDKLITDEHPAVFGHALFSGRGWLTDLVDHVVQLHDEMVAWHSDLDQRVTAYYDEISKVLSTEPEPEPEAHTYEVLFASYCEQEGFSSQTSADQKYTWFTIELVMPEWTEQIRLVNRNMYSQGQWTAKVRVAWDISIDDVSVHVKVRPLSEYCLDPYHLTPKRCGLYAEQLHLAGCMGSQIQAYIDTRRSQ